MHTKKENILSCIQPTGDLHLGNYLGAVQNWVELQDNYHCTYGVVDYHALTTSYNAKKLRARSWDMAFQLIACGIKTENIFLHSLIPEHTDLCWILSNFASYGELTRMTQFKDKAAMVKEKDKNALVSGGLFFYPVLQAADILIYHTHYVPVGQDQKQHLELSRTIAQRFNNHFKTDYFPVPEPLFTKTSKVLSLADPSHKMSKSLGEKHYINIFSDPKKIRKQIMSAVTDSGVPGKKMSPGMTNLFALLSAFADEKRVNKFKEDYQNGELRYADLKESIAENMLPTLDPIRNRYEEIKNEKREYKYKLKESSKKIRQRAVQTLKEVRDITGLAAL